jgi:hypothetical protein
VSGGAGGLLRKEGVVLWVNVVVVWRHVAFIGRLLFAKALVLSLFVLDGARDRRNDSGACGTNTNGRA